MRQSATLKGGGGAPHTHGLAYFVGNAIARVSVPEATSMIGQRRTRAVRGGRRRANSRDLRSPPQAHHGPPPPLHGLHQPLRLPRQRVALLLRVRRPVVDPRHASLVTRGVV